MKYEQAPTLYYDVFPNTMTQSDSIGYYHNLIMCEVDRNRFSLMKNGEIDVEKLYMFIVNNLYWRKIVPVEFLYNKDIKAGFMDLAKNAMYISQRALVDGYDIGYITSQQQIMLRNKYRLEPSEYRFYSQINNRVLGQCCHMSNPMIKSYAKDFNDMVFDSNMNIDVKEEVMYLGQFAVNSALCWTPN